MLMEYYEGIKKPNGKLHIAGKYQCETDDFYKYWQNRPKDVFYVNVYLKDGRHYEWSKQKGWNSVRGLRIDGK